MARGLFQEGERNSVTCPAVRLIQLWASVRCSDFATKHTRIAGAAWFALTAPIRRQRRGSVALLPSKSRGSPCHDQIARQLPRRHEGGRPRRIEAQPPRGDAQRIADDREPREQEDGTSILTNSLQTLHLPFLRDEAADQIRSHAAESVAECRHRERRPIKPWVVAEDAKENGFRPTRQQSGAEKAAQKHRAQTCRRIHAGSRVSEFYARRVNGG